MLIFQYCMRFPVWPILYKNTNYFIMIKPECWLSALIIAASVFANAQQVTQSIKGRIIDKETQLPLPGATIAILDSDPVMGAVADADGNFVIRNVPVGRYTLRANFITYEPVLLSELLVSSGKELVLTVEMQEAVTSIGEVVVRTDKSRPLNSMATVSARQFSVEETKRFAGGFDDPARLVSSFAGVSGNLGTNGIVIRGNAPKGLLWQMEGVEISNPGHFANVSAMGAGAITALSSQMLANSDFYTGAFPAEYGNALSGVFDINFRTGNSEKSEKAVQAGILGLDVSAEGPFVKGKKSSFLFNYRYSTLTLLAPILPEEMGKLNYQDLAFKLNFPTAKSGTFSLWGLGALDYQGRDAKLDPSLWETDFDRQQYQTNLYMFAAGLNHRIILGSKTYLNTVVAVSGNGLRLREKEADVSQMLLPIGNTDNLTNKFTLSSYINHKFSAGFTNKTGVNISDLQYNMNIRQAGPDQILNTYADAKGNSYLVQAYTQSKIKFTDAVTMNLGVHSQFFTLNHHYTVEPRLGFRWDLSPKQTIGVSYGLHSQLEPLNFYFAQQEPDTGTAEPNRGLDFSKAQHLVLSYEIKLNSNTHLEIEPYYQRLSDIPVIPDSWYSLQNLEFPVYFNDSLVNQGRGVNLGIDITWERFLNKGFYYLVTASVFDSKYWGGDGIKRNSRFNKHYVVNILGGKEWQVGRSQSNILSISGKLSLMGGDYFTPPDPDLTYAAQDIVEDESRIFADRKPDAQILSFAVTYRVNKVKYAGIWSLNFINALFYKEFNRYYFDKTTNSIRKDINELVVPNISYKIEF